MRSWATIVLALSMLAGTLALPGVDAVAPKGAALRSPGLLDGEARDGGQRAADRVIERQVRRAIRADPFLTLAGPRVKVTSRRGVVRLLGRVRTAKERSSLAFKAGQNAWGGRVDNRVTIGDG